MYTRNEIIANINIEDEMRRSYIDYSMSVIIGRALPEVRDGLKPGRRRALDAGELGSPSRLVDLAEENFGVRALDLGYWSRSEVERPWLLPPSSEDKKRPLIALPGE